MDEQDFDKLYSSKLPDFTSSDWRMMEGALDRHDLKKKLTRLMWALPVLGVLLLGVSATLFYQLKQTQNNVRNLESQLVSVYEKKPIKIDETPPPIILHDTIYKNIIIRQIVRETNPENTNLANNPNNIYYEKYDKTNTENQIVVLEREKIIGLNELEGKVVVVNTTKMSKPKDFSAYKGGIIPEDSLVADNNFSLIPKSVTVSVLGGLQQSQIQDDEHGGRGANINLRTVLGYNNGKGQERWGLVLDFQQSNTFRGKNDPNGYGGKPPRGNPNRVEKVSSLTQFNIGLRYNLLFNKKIEPYFGVNWGFQIPIRNYREYHTDNQPNVPIDVIDEPQQTASQQILGVNLGVNLKVLRRLSVNGEMFYQTPISTANNLLESNTVGGRIGVSYRLF